MSFLELKALTQLSDDRRYVGKDGRRYVVGLGRDYPHPLVAHLYDGDYSDPGSGMCRKAWNRDDGQSWSIWRGNVGKRGICAACRKRADKGLDGVPAAEGEPDGDDE